jgi:hypothetical protein
LGSFFQLALKPSQLASKRISRLPSPSFRVHFAKLASKRKHRPASIGFVFSNLFPRQSAPVGSFFQLPQTFAIGFEAYFSPAISFSSPPLRKIGFEAKIPAWPDHATVGSVLTNLPRSKSQLASKRFSPSYLLFFASALQKTPFLRLSPPPPELSRAIQRPPVMPNYSW